ncbi:MAG: hypothetical protein Q7R57_10425 [Dehalococcoidales bacterium]|nr:hypothetical protein [Dehalococcoidales bacterium]
MKQLLALIIAVLLAVSACTASGTTAGKGTVTVSSKADTEGSLLGQVIAQMLRANGFNVKESPAIVARSYLTAKGFLK